jgi:hypothetical protein
MSNRILLHVHSDFASRLSQISPALRRALLHLNELHPEDFELVARALSNRYANPYEAPSFRFLNLPAELRLQVAAYAVTNGDAWPLKFCWTAYRPDDRVGSFVTALYQQLSLDELTARVCAMRFSHAEARGLIWANNALVFDQRPVKCATDADLPEVQEHSASDGYKHILETFPYALTHYPEAFLKTHHVVFETFLSEWIGPERGDTAFRVHVLARMIALAASLPNVTFRFRDTNWFPYPWRNKPSDLLQFLVTGRKLKTSLSALYGEVRNWKLYPSIFEDDEAALISHLDEANGEEVKDWIENGI